MNGTINMQSGNLCLNGYNADEQTELLEAENMVLGAVFLEPSIIHELILEPQHFFQRGIQFIFKAMLELRQQERMIDMITMMDQLGTGKLQAIGGISYLSWLSVTCPSAANVEEYQRIVLEHFKNRELKRVAADFLNNGSMEDAERFYQTYIHMQELGRVHKDTKQDVIMEIYDEMYEDHGDIQGIDTGYVSLNQMTSGWNKGDLIILAARPSVGKTAFALNLAMNCCKKGGVVDLFSLEMPNKQLVKRMLSNLTGIDGAKWRNSYRLFTEEDRAKATTALEIYYKWNFQIDDHSTQTVSDIRARIQKTRREFPDSDYLVVIDYLQLISVTGKHDRHDLAIASITQELKRIAKQYQVPIILLSQLSRGVEQRIDKRPRMSDLRDSGSIEQDADVIMLLYRDEYYNRENEENKIIEIEIAKQRNGPVGTVKMVFEREVGVFVDVLDTKKKSLHNEL
ncbi:replicative DNA helicase [Neobacillus sp. NRS-1170]|uniref:replicative DNA helicase n=1 Tax=Neobacillus sp. NRS-1170 TaxID=3233898 RepID=UPI003D29E88F